MSRKILLVEPNYRNKYPPIGLMKIATYHRRLGDEVTFFKGDLKELVLNQICEECLKKMNFLDRNIDWSIHQDAIKQFIKSKKKTFLEEIPIGDSKFEILLLNCLSDYADYFRKKKYEKYPEYDRVYVTTLFTFYWKITIKTINFAKQLVKEPHEIRVGGVLASLLPTEVEEATGIKPLEGLLDKPGILDKGNTMIIDDLPLDYSILYEIDYEYPTSSAYFTFMTKGCTRKCAFCSVPKLEPTYKPKIETYDKFQEVKAYFGEQQNLLLMDNNVLASPKFPEIIQEIKDMGFVKGATYKEPNQLDIAIENLKIGYNDKGFVRRVHRLLNDLLEERLKDKEVKVRQPFYNQLEKYGLLDLKTTTKENILKIYPEIKDFFENYRIKTNRRRYVDFNQGTDCRYVTDELMKLMSEIPIRPLRIAFDYLGLKKKYVAAVELAAKYGIKDLSNYLLYNFKDSPDQLYERMKINVELNEKLGISIYSFPMKYIPLFGEAAKHRQFVGDKWNKKFIRAIQSILNVTKGIVPPERSFFEKAFGKNVQEYFNILYMPETYIVYRKIFEEVGLTHKWAVDFNSLDEDQLIIAKGIIEYGDFEHIHEKTNDPKILELLNHYTTKKEEKPVIDFDVEEVRTQYKKLIEEDMFINLTLTYDFEETDNEHANVEELEIIEV